VEIASRHRCRRQGRPLANLTDAHPVIVLADEGGDASVVKAILAVKVLDQDFSRATWSPRWCCFNTRGP
jgi:hypothetical protein